jgi:murein DD-endopeptidase MepM/ murein hydrolase activator NlpD
MSRSFAWRGKLFLVRRAAPKGRRAAGAATAPVQIKGANRPYWLAEAGLGVRRFLARPLTLLLVPPRGMQVKGVKIPLWLVATGGLIVSVLLLFSVFTCIRAAELQGEMLELNQLRRVNAEQGTTLQSLQQEAQQDRATMQDINNLEQRVRAMAGMGGNGQASRAEPAGGTAVQRAMLLGAFFRPALSASAVAANLGEVTQDAASTRQDLELLQGDLNARLQAAQAMPDHWPLYGPITSPFGVRSNPFSGEGAEFHTGIDIAAPYGTSVEAAGAGVVVFVGYKADYGKTIIIDHGNGYQSWYCHLSSVLTAVGKRALKGEVIGRVGMTGRTTGPHLHLTVTMNGALINPQPLLKT